MRLFSQRLILTDSSSSTTSQNGALPRIGAGVAKAARYTKKMIVETLKRMGLLWGEFRSFGAWTPAHPSKQPTNGVPFDDFVVNAWLFVGVGVLRLHYLINGVGTPLCAGSALLPLVRTRLRQKR